MVTSEQKKIKKIGELYEEGLTTDEIANKLRTNKKQVLRLLHYYLAIKYKEE